VLIVVVVITLFINLIDIKNVVNSFGDSKMERTLQEKARCTDVYVAIETLRIMVLGSKKLSKEERKQIRHCLKLIYDRLEVEMLTR
jgi:hypothetical protein